MPIRSEFWRPVFQSFFTGGPGIAVMVEGPTPGYVPAGFQNRVNDALTYINATPTGAAILNALSWNSATGISPAYGAMGNRCATNNMNQALNQVASEILSTNPGVQATAALTNTFGPAPACYDALAAFINATPAWDISRLPNTGPGLKGWIDELRARVNRFLLRFWGYNRPAWNESNEGYFQNQRWFGGRWGRTGRNIGVTGAALQNWFAGVGLPPPFNMGANLNHIRNSTIVALEAHSPPGPGSKSMVTWQTGPGGMNPNRPPAIGLAHELLHAYFSFRGEQPGNEYGLGVDESMVLFEYKCIGLGPWDENVPSENSIRREWAAPLAGVIPIGDMENHKVPPKRIQN